MFKNFTMKQDDNKTCATESHITARWHERGLSIIAYKKNFHVFEHILWFQSYIYRIKSNAACTEFIPRICWRRILNSPAITAWSGGLSKKKSRANTKKILARMRSSTVAAARCYSTLRSCVTRSESSGDRGGLRQCLITLQISLLKQTAIKFRLN